MSKKKKHKKQKNSKHSTLEKLVLATAILNLIGNIIELLKSLID